MAARSAENVTALNAHRATHRTITDSSLIPGEIRIRQPSQAGRQAGTECHLVLTLKIKPWRVHSGVGVGSNQFC